MPCCLTQEKDVVAVVLSSMDYDVETWTRVKLQEN